MSEKIDVESVEANPLYMMSQAMDLILKDADRRMRAKRGEFRHEKKYLFNRYAKAVKEACVLSEQLGEDIITSAATKDFKEFDTWQEESNELARLMLLYADKSSEEGATEAIFGYLNSFRGAGIITEDVLKRFYLK